MERVLYHLWKVDGINQQDLCEATFIDKPSMTRLIDNLEKTGLAKRIASPHDKRKNLVVLAEKAKTLQGLCYGLAAEAVHEALKGVSRKNIESCRIVLNKVYDNLK